jgi:hypothetical protein
VFPGIPVTSANDTCASPAPVIMATGVEQVFRVDTTGATSNYSGTCSSDAEVVLSAALPVGSTKLTMTGRGGSGSVKIRFQGACPPAAGGVCWTVSCFPGASSSTTTTLSPTTYFFMYHAAATGLCSVGLTVE